MPPPPRPSPPPTSPRRRSALRLPAFVLVGDRDEATPLGHAEALRAAIPGARLRLIGGAAHIPTLEQPRLVTEALLDFLHPATV
jgi:pimeloyl-ACP methyl ester carboxylesterase